MKIRYFLTTLILMMLFITPTKAVENVDASLKIYDYGAFLTPDEEVEIKASIDDFIDTYDLDMVIVTKKDYTGDLKAYGQDFYDYNAFGVNKTNDGILLAFNEDELGMEAYIVTTGEGIRMYDDDRIDSIIRSMSYVKEDGEAVVIKEFVSEASRYASYGIPESNVDTYIDENGEYHVRDKYPLVAFITISSVVAIITLLILINKNKMVYKAVDAKGYLNQDSVKKTVKNDQFVFHQLIVVVVGDLVSVMAVAASLMVVAEVVYS